MARKGLNHPENLFHGIFHIFYGLVGGHGFFKTRHCAKNWEKGVDSGCIAGGGVGGDTAGKSQHRLAVLFGGLGHADGGFSEDGLAIQTALAGDDKIGVFHIVGKAGFIEDDLDAGFQFPMEEG